MAGIPAGLADANRATVNRVHSTNLLPVFGQPNRSRSNLAVFRPAGVQAVFVHLLAEFKLACERTQGGSTYSAKMAEWFGIEQDASSRWAIVGVHREKLMVATMSLPPSMHTLYELCSVPADVIAKKATSASASNRKSATGAMLRRISAIPMERSVGQLGGALQ